MVAKLKGKKRSSTAQQKQQTQKYKIKFQVNIYNKRQRRDNGNLGERTKTTKKKVSMKKKKCRKITKLQYLRNEKQLKKWQSVTFKRLATKMMALKHKQNEKENNDEKSKRCKSCEIDNYFWHSEMVSSKQHNRHRNQCNLTLKYPMALYGIHFQKDSVAINYAKINGVGTNNNPISPFSISNQRKTDKLAIK